MDTIKKLEVYEVTGTLRIDVAKGVHWNVCTYPDGCGLSADLTFFSPTEDDLLRIITGASDGLMKLREYNATKGE